MGFPPEFLGELRNRIPLADVIGRRVKLTRRGREYLGPCPFHNEKTPSFTVNEEKGFYHCFGCGAHGDVIEFVMRSDNLPFPEAVERLAEDIGLAVPESSPQDRAREKERHSLLEVVETAALWFTKQLMGARGGEARADPELRGLAEIIVGKQRSGPVGIVKCRFFHEYTRFENLGDDYDGGEGGAFDPGPDDFAKP